VRVSGSRIIPSNPYTLKLEGAKTSGYRSIFGSKTDNRGALTAAQLEWFRNKDIQNAPDVALLTASRTNGTLIISWPVYPGGFRLETSSNLTTVLAWQAVTNTPAVNGDQNIVTVPLAESFAAFRLARSAP